jgi:putative component of membrane protein insertase Oxa1/YidC/SpoIIIJ protein YidD
LTYSALGLALLLASGAAADPLPWGWREHARWGAAAPAAQGPPVMAEAPAWERAIRYYKRNVSVLQGPRCPSYPSCSEFTLRSMRLFGFWRGFFMGVERIYLRENAGMDRGPYLRLELGDGERKFYDPPEADDVFAPEDWRLADPEYRGLFPGGT